MQRISCDAIATPSVNSVLTTLFKRGETPIKNQKPSSVATTQLSKTTFLMTKLSRSEIASFHHRPGPPLGFSSAALHWEPETAEPVPDSPDPQPHAVIVRGGIQGRREVPAEGGLDELTAATADHKQGTILRDFYVVFTVFIFYLMLFCQHKGFFCCFFCGHEKKFPINASRVLPRHQNACNVPTPFVCGNIFEDRVRESEGELKKPRNQPNRTVTVPSR